MLEDLYSIHLSPALLTYAIGATLWVLTSVVHVALEAANVGAIQREKLQGRLETANYAVSQVGQITYFIQLQLGLQGIIKYCGLGRLNSA